MITTIFTLFPEYFSSVLSSSMLKRAQEKKHIVYELVNIRDFASDRHNTTDDTPYGGGAGMVMMIEPIDKALSSKNYSKGSSNELIIATSAKGKLFKQPDAEEFAQLDRLAILCGHYEGIDQRVIDHLVDVEMRVGDYVLTGGEPAAAVIVDSVSRLVPGVLGNEQSLEGESHSRDVHFSAPVYTKPAEYKGWEVPEVLLSGHHEKIKRWREEEKVEK